MNLLEFNPSFLFWFYCKNEKICSDLLKNSYYKEHLLMTAFYPWSIYLPRILLYLQENSVLHILKLKWNAVSQTLRGHFSIEQYLPVLIVEKYTRIQENITLKSDALQMLIQMTTFNFVKKFKKPTSKARHCIKSRKLGRNTVDKSMK